MNNNQHDLSQKQRWVLEKYISYFEKDQFLQDEFKWPDGMNAFSSRYTIMCKRILQQGWYDDDDIGLLNNSVRPLVVENKRK